jgi:hypothetical protein
METKDGSFVARAADPFDASARTRLVHMGVANETGKVSENAVKSFAAIFAGLFFDDVLDCLGDPKTAEDICESLEELNTRNGDGRRAYLFLSFLYDRMRKPLPDPVWWLAGNPEAVNMFIKHFVAGLGRLAKEPAESQSEEYEGKEA